MFFTECEALDERHAVAVEGFRKAGVSRTSNLPEIATQTPDWMFRCQECGDAYMRQWEMDVQRSEKAGAEHAALCESNEKEWNAKMAKIDAEMFHRWANSSKRVQEWRAKNGLPKKPRFEH